MAASVGLSQGALDQRAEAVVSAVLDVIGACGVHRRPEPAKLYPYRLPVRGFRCDPGDLTEQVKETLGDLGFAGTVTAGLIDR